MIDEHVAELEAALARAGVGGHLRRRLAAEARDHLHEAAAAHGEAAAVRAFGRPDGIAAQVSAELATERTRLATLSTFAVLALCGALYAVLFLTLPAAAAPGRASGLVAVAFAGLVLLPQIAFVAGCLALAGALRDSRRDARADGELRQAWWRTGVALAAGAGTLACLLALALGRGGALPSWWVTVAGAGAAVLLPACGASGALLAAATRPRVRAPGPATDLVADLAALGTAVPGLRALVPRTSGRLATATAALAALGVVTAGAVAGDPLDGLLRGVLEAGAVLGCYAVLGRRLGLRRA